MYELIIVGGGMSGISVGHFFRDRKILLLEKGKLLSGASGNNAGFIISGFGEHFAKTAERLGAKTAGEIQEIHLSSHRRIKSLAGTIDCDYNPSGSYALALSEKEWQELRESYGMMRSFGYGVELIENPTAGLRRSPGALFNPDDAYFDSVKFWSGVAEGLPVKTHSEVTAVYNKGDSLVVECGAQAYETERVVYCLNAFSAVLLPELEGKYIPLRGQMFETPLQGPAPSQVPIYAQHGDVFWRFTDRTFQFGGLESLSPKDEVGVAERSSASLLAEQIRWVRTNFDPNLFKQPIQPTQTRFSTLAYTLDGFPFVGELTRRNQYVLAGLCGMGNSYALEAAYWVQRLIDTGENLIPSFCRSDRINGLLAYTGGDWRKIYEAWNH